MSDDLIIKQTLTEKRINKIKVSSAEIVVSVTKDKPYYEIKYSDLSDNEIHIGYGSYDLEIVFEYLEKYFEIVNEEVDLKQIEANDDLISRKAVLEVLYDISNRNYGSFFGYGINKACDVIERAETAFDKEKVIEELEDYLFEKYCVEGDSRIDKIVEKGGIE